MEIANNQIKIYSLVKKIFSKAIFFYVVLFFLSSFIVDYKKIQFQAQLREINANMPASFAYLAQFSEGEVGVDKNQLSRYLVFYSRIAKYFPKEPEAHAMMGYCFYHLGYFDLAVKKYLQAQALQPDFFWNNYNLAVLYLENKKLDLVRRYFQKALDCSAEENREQILQSRVIYKTIIIDQPQFDKNIISRIQQAKEFVRYWLENTPTLTNFSSQTPAINKSHPQLKVF